MQSFLYLLTSSCYWDKTISFHLYLLSVLLFLFISQCGNNFGCPAATWLRVDAKSYDSFFFFIITVHKQSRFFVFVCSLLLQGICLICNFMPLSALLLFTTSACIKLLHSCNDTCSLGRILSCQRHCFSLFLYLPHFSLSLISSTLFTPQICSFPTSLSLLFPYPSLSDSPTETW